MTTYTLGLGDTTDTLARYPPKWLVSDAFLRLLQHSRIMLKAI
jgi:hypothetical protein